MPQPLVSAIVSTYNSEKFIEGKILDLLNQTIISDIEIIIINSGSQQNEEEIVKKYLGKPNIKYFKTQLRETIYKAWNRGIKMSKGRFITNANTDDRLRSDAFEILSNTLLKHDDVALVYADQYYTNLPNTTFDPKKIKAKVNLPEYDPVTHLERCLILSQPMWRSSVHFSDNIWFNESYEICGDHEFHLKIAKNHKILHIPLVLGSFYKSEKNKNKSFNDIQLVTRERQEITEFFIRDFLLNLNKDEVLFLNIQKKFEWLTRLPIVLFLLRFKILYFLFRNKHHHLLEFSYFFYSVLLETNHSYNEALKVCNKFLEKRNSLRIKEQKEKLLKLINNSGKNELER